MKIASTDQLLLPDSRAAMRNFSRKFAWPEWPWYAAGLVMLAATNYISLKIPQFAKVVVNEVNATNLNHMQKLAWSIIGLGVLLILIRTLSRILVFWPGRKIETSAKSHLFDRLMHLPQMFFDRHGMGDIISRIANDITHIRVFYGFGALQVMNLIFLMGFTISQMVSTHLQLSIAALSPLILMIVILRITMPKMHRYSLENQQIQGDLTNRTTEAFINIPVVKANGATAAFAERISVENERVYASNIRLLIIRQVTFPLMSLLAGISQVVVLFYGGKEVLAGRLSVGDIMAFNVYITYLAFPLSAIGIVISVYQRALTAIQRIDVIEKEEIESSPAAPKSLSAPYTLEVRDLTYAFPQKSGGKDAKPALSHVSLKLPPKNRLGIYGQIGSGKSCLMNLISRIYDPPRHAIFINGIDVCDLNPDEVRRIIGYTQQSAHLFSASIADNIRFGIDTDDYSMLQAAAKSEIASDISELKNQWKTEVGERGIRLSGGQKQRLALTRVLVRKPAIMMLDDVTSAVDQSTERKILENLYTEDCSLIISSHRISALKSCDEVLLMKDGHIVDRGSAEELIARHPEIDDRETEK